MGAQGHARALARAEARGARAARLDLAVLAVAVQAVDGAAEDLGDVDGDVQGADDAAVAVGQAVLDVVERGVDEHAAVVPGRALHPDGLMHCSSSSNDCTCAACPIVEKNSAASICTLLGPAMLKETQPQCGSMTSLHCCLLAGLAFMRPGRLI